MQEIKENNSLPPQAKPIPTQTRKTVFGIIIFVVICAILVFQSRRIATQNALLKDKDNSQLQMKTEEQRLKDKIAEMEAVIAKAKNEIEELKIQQELKAQQELKLQAELGDLKAKLSLNADRLKQIDKENAVLLQDLFQARAQRQEAQEKYEELVKDIDKNIIKQQNSDEKERVKQEKEKRNHELQLTRAAAKKEIEELKENISKLNKQYAEARTKNAELQSELASLKKLYEQLQAKSKELYFLAKDAENIPSLEKAIDSLKKERKFLIEKVEKQNKEIEEFGKLKAQIFREVGSVFLQARLFDLAIDYYTKSLALDPGYADVYYKLGLLYKQSHDNNAKSVYYFKKYLEFNPQARNRKDVEYMIKMLTQPKLK